jgi:hypothetical protein
MGGGPLLGGPSQVKTLVRLHVPHTPQQSFGATHPARKM